MKVLVIQVKKVKHSSLRCQGALEMQKTCKPRQRDEVLCHDQTLLMTVLKSRILLYLKGDNRNVKAWIEGRVHTGERSETKDFVLFCFV